MYEINSEANHNLVYLHNVTLGYVQEIANKKKSANIIIQKKAQKDQFLFTLNSEGRLFKNCV